MTKRWFLLLFVPFFFLVAGCGQTDGSGNAPEAEQLEDEAEVYIEQSQEDLAGRLGITTTEIELDSITRPAEAEGVYIIMLETNGANYEYHGRDGEVLLVSEPLPPASDG